jgi:hypothetical protein
VRTIVVCLSIAVAVNQAFGAQALGWRPHSVKQGNGRGGWTERPADIQFLHKRGGKYVFPFGLVAMDNAEVLLLASWHDGQSEKPVVAFSKDRGDTWSAFELATDGRTAHAGAGGSGVDAGRPMMLTDLGKGRLTFQSDKRFVSYDYGRTWNENIPVAAHQGGAAWSVEGNALVDRGADGRAARVAEIGWFYEPGKKHPIDDATAAIRWSDDGCRTWHDEVRPPQWKLTVPHNGKSHVCGVSEGSLVRAANGWLVAALRTDMPPRYFNQPNDDSLEGTGVSISTDDGKSWSPISVLFDAGRHHAHLLRLPNGDLVMTLIVRDDIREGKLFSYRRGCEAFLSHDNGLTWDIDRRFVLDEFEFFDGEKWYNGETGHLASALLDDGSILTAYGKYLSKGVNLIRWCPTVAKRAEAH